MTQTRFSPVILTTLALAAGTPLALAQDQDGDGRTLRVTLNQSLTANDNLALAADSAGTTLQALTRLGFALTTEGATDRLALTGGLGLRLVDGPGTDGLEWRLADPRIALAYSRLGAAAQLDLDLGYRQDDIAFLRPLTDFAGPGGVVDLPEDLDDLTGTGTRHALSFGARLELRRDAPLGVTLSAGQERLSYSDVTDPELIDTTRSRLGLGLRLDISPALAATADLTASRFATAAEPDRDTLALAGALRLVRPDGEWRFTLDLADTPDGTRSGLGLARGLELPNGGIDLSLGLTRGVEGDLGLVGALDYQRLHAGGEITAGLRHSLSTGNDDTEQRVTALNLGLTQALGADWSLSLEAAWARTEATATGTRDDRTDLGLTLSRALTPDWSVDLGLTHQIRDEAADTGLSLSIGRAFTLPF